MAFRTRKPVQKVGSPAGRTTRTLTARERQVVASFLDAAAALERSVDSTLIQQLIRQGSTAALGSLDTGGFVTALEPMVTAIQAEIAAGGVAAIGELPTTLRGAYRFDALDPRAIAWAQTRAGALIAQVTDEQRAILNRVLARSIENGWTVQQTTQDLRQVIGLHDRWASAVSSAWDRDYDRLLRSGLSDAVARQQADAIADRYRNRLLQARAKNIARTEILTAGNQGRWLSWAQGVEGGYISKTATKQWTTGPLVTRSPKRIQVCDVCAPLRGETRRWDEPFSNGVMMPPAHPSCRCSSELVPLSIEEVRDRLRDADKPAEPAEIERVPGKGTPTGQPWDVDVPQFKTAQEAEDWLNQRWGTRYNGNPREFRLGDIDPDAAKMIARELDDLFKQYPQVAEYLNTVGSGKQFNRVMGGSNGIASASKGFLYYRESDYVTKEFLRHGLPAKQRNWWSSGNPAGTIHHEFGHHVHFYIERMNTRYASISLSEKYLQDALAPVIKDTLGLKGKVGFSGDRTKQAIAENLSRYGSTDVCEMIAEGFAESMSGEAVRPLASAIRKWLDDEVAKFA